MELKNDLLLKALLRQPVDRTPVWIMRQAGRYLPEYLKTRAEAGSFMNLCQNPELACEVTLQPLRRFELDAAIIFSDILTIPDAMGMGLYFETGEGPKFERPVSSRAEIEKLPRPDIASSLQYVMDAISLTRKELGGKVPLLGFSGSPWTLATYMIEGGSSKTFGKAKRLVYQEPETAHLLLSKLADTVTDYLNAQIESGAQGVQIFDTWGGALSFNAYREFSLRYMQQIVAGLKREHEGRKIPVILFSKGCNTQLEALADSGCDALGVDWTITLSEARQRVGDRVALQGNLDPSILLASPEVVRREAGQTLASFGHGEGHVFNLGHGITPDVNPEHLAALVDAVRELSPAYHQG
ncbi:MAG: uroporphyrinogen decarboxylase [Xanthomonadales bacterium]|jgi:uroporphyrinogen decarboxylase|nr:uroporphyrinogen decarboxylase [Xanthomonadales bacterium]